MGGKIISEYRDPTFSPAQATEHKLSVLIGVGSLCYEVSDALGRSLVWKDCELPAGDSRNEAIRILIQNELPLREQRYNAVSIAFFCEPAALVPARLFDASRVSSYWDTVSDPATGCKIASDVLPALQARFVYPLSEQLENILLAQWADARLFHAGTAWLEGVCRNMIAAHPRAMYVHVSGGRLLVAAFDNGALRFINFFDYQHARDFLYYSLLALDQAQFSLEDTHLFLSGKMTVEAEIFQLLQRYFINLHFLSPASAGAFPAELPEDRRHWYFDLVCTRLF
ncbi:MAG: DUF3822 family protein [Saprospiraceae bacterium]|nr:DUF3822 family protein [Saprospiraceae bacterium]